MTKISMTKIKDGKIYYNNILYNFLYIYIVPCNTMLYG